MAKTQKETVVVEKVNLLEGIRESLKTIRKFSTLKESIFATLKTTKKEMLLKEVINLTDLVNRL